MPTVLIVILVFLALFVIVGFVRIGKKESNENSPKTPNEITEPTIVITETVSELPKKTAKKSSKKVAKKAKKKRNDRKF